MSTAPPDACDGPPDDSGLLGNVEVRARLLSLAAAGRLHPCLVFEGPDGVGKAATAQWLARRMNCEETDGTGPACGRCWSCRMIPKGHHPDVIVVGPDPDRATRVVSVRQARALMEQLTLRPRHARRRFVIIDPADAMNPEAANALLKTFEEPPEDTGFVLVTAQAGSLLGTVRSRSQRVRFGPVPHADLDGWLAARGVDDAPWIARLSDGCPGQALALADGGAARWVDARNALLDAISGKIEAVFAFGEKRARGARAVWRPQLELALDGLDRMLQDAWRWHVRGPLPDSALYNPDQRARVSAWAGVLDAGGVARCAAAVSEARSQLDANVNGRILTDALLTRLATELGPARKVAVS